MKVQHSDLLAGQYWVNHLTSLISYFFNYKLEVRTTPSDLWWGLNERMFAKRNMQKKHGAFHSELFLGENISRLYNWRTSWKILLRWWETQVIPTYLSWFVLRQNLSLGGVTRMSLRLRCWCCAWDHWALVNKVSSAKPLRMAVDMGPFFFLPSLFLGPNDVHQTCSKNLPDREHSYLDPSAVYTREGEGRSPGSQRESMARQD